MRSKRVAAAVLFAGGTAWTLAMAVPAQADPAADQRSELIDQQFTKAVRKEGLPITASSAIDLAHSTCDALKRRGSIQDATFHVKYATDWSDVKDIGTFGSLAIQAYCPTAMPR